MKFSIAFPFIAAALACNVAGSPIKRDQASLDQAAIQSQSEAMQSLVNIANKNAEQESRIQKQAVESLIGAAADLADNSQQQPTSVANAGQGSNNVVVVTEIVTVTADQEANASGAASAANAPPANAPPANAPPATPGDSSTNIGGQADGEETDNKNTDAAQEDNNTDTAGNSAAGQASGNPARAEMVTSSSAAASPPTADDTNAAAVSLPTIQPASPTEPVQTSSIQQLQEPTQQGPASTSSSGGSGGSGSSSGQTFSGDGTYYTPGLGACGKTNTESDLIAAINAPQYGTNANPNSAPVCGKCALVKGPNGQVKVTITDRCPVCKSGDLDLSPAAFTQIGDLNAGRISITWSFVDC